MPGKNYFKPRGIPSSQFDEVVLSLDEYESLRLADFAGLYQEQEEKTDEEARAANQKVVLDALGGLPDDHHHCALLTASTLAAACDDF